MVKLWRESQQKHISTRKLTPAEFSRLIVNFSPLGDAIYEHLKDVKKFNVVISQTEGFSKNRTGLTEDEMKQVDDKVEEKVKSNKAKGGNLGDWITEAKRFEPHFRKAAERGLG